MIKELQNHSLRRTRLSTTSSGYTDAFATPMTTTLQCPAPLTLVTKKLKLWLLSASVTNSVQRCDTKHQCPDFEREKCVQKSRLNCTPCTVLQASEAFITKEPDYICVYVHACCANSDTMSTQSAWGYVIYRALVFFVIVHIQLFSSCLSMCVIVISRVRGMYSIWAHVQGLSAMNAMPPECQ